MQTIISLSYFHVIRGGLIHFYKKCDVYLWSSHWDVFTTGWLLVQCRQTTGHQSWLWLRQTESHSNWTHHSHPSPLARLLLTSLSCFSQKSNSRISIVHLFVENIINQLLCSIFKYHQMSSHIIRHLEASSSSIKHEQVSSSIIIIQALFKHHWNNQLSVL